MVLLAVAGHRRPADGRDHLTAPLGVVEQLYLVGKPSVIWNGYGFSRGERKVLRFHSHNGQMDHDLDHLDLTERSF